MGGGRRVGVGCEMKFLKWWKKIKLLTSHSLPVLLLLQYSLCHLFSFQKFDYNVSRWGSLWVYAIWNLFNFAFHQIRKFSAIISSNIIFVPCCISSLLGLQLSLCWYACWCPTGLLGSIHPSSLFFFFLLIRLSNSNQLTSKSANSCFASSNLWLEPSRQFFISVISLFNFKFPFDSF